MIVLIIQLAILVLLIGVIWYMFTLCYMVYRGCNYIPTPKRKIDIALSVLKKGDIFIDLGFGYGEVMEVALEKKAKKAIGYELDFIRYLRTRLYFAYKEIKPATFMYRDIWSADLHEADVVFTFFTVLHTKKLYEKAKKEMKQGSWFVSYKHIVPGIRPTKTIEDVYFFKM